MTNKLLLLAFLMFLPCYVFASDIDCTVAGGIIVKPEQDISANDNNILYFVLRGLSSEKQVVIQPIGPYRNDMVTLSCRAWGPGTKITQISSPSSTALEFTVLKWDTAAKTLPQSEPFELNKTTLSNSQTTWYFVHINHKDSSPITITFFGE